MKGIIWEPITDEDVVNYVVNEQKYWEPISFDGKHYILTFQNNVYEVII